MANTQLVLQQARGPIEYAAFGSANVWTFPSYTLAANQTTPIAAAQLPLPCNVKILAVAALAAGASGNGLAIDISSGPGFGTFATGTITFTGTAGSTGTCTITIGDANTALQQTIGPFAITSANTATQSAAAAVAAINAVTVNPQIYATNTAGVVTIYQLTSGSTLTYLGAQTYKAVLTGVSTQTVAPTTATAFTGTPTAARGTADTTNLGIVPSTTAASGQLLFGALRPVLISANGTNTVIYPGGGLGQGAGWDIIFPVTRSLTLVLFASGQSASTVVQVSVLAVPIILDPTQPHVAQWAPNNTTIGAPAGD